MRGRWLKGRPVYLNRRGAGRVKTLLYRDSKVVVRAVAGLLGRVTDVMWRPQDRPRRRLEFSQRCHEDCFPLLDARVVSGDVPIGRCADVFFTPEGVVEAVMVSRGLWTDFFQGRSLLPAARLTFTDTAVVVKEDQA